MCSIFRLFSKYNFILSQLSYCCSVFLFFSVTVTLHTPNESQGLGIRITVIYQSLTGPEQSSRLDFEVYLEEKTKENSNIINKMVCCKHPSYRPNFNFGLLTLPVQRGIIISLDNLDKLLACFWLFLCL